MEKINNEVYFVCGKERRIGEIANCKSCQREFIRRKMALGVRQTECCSKQCSFNLRRSNRVDCVCHCCSKQIKKPKSKLKNSKHGFQFCSRICKEKAQSLSGNCPEIRPSHYGLENSKQYRDTAFRNLDCKCKCGITHKMFLVVHHMDGCRDNNKIENLEVVCHNCHAIRHMKWLDEDWHFCPSALTPREKISELEKHIYGKELEN